VKKEAIHPLLLLVSNDCDDTVLTAEEAAELDQCVEEFHKNPESFISIDELTAQYERGEF
jgi:hypothetical protein